MRPSRLLRNRLLGATRRLAEPIARWRAERQEPRVELAAVQRRLELLLGAMYGRPLRVVARGASATPSPDDVVLPLTLPGGGDALERYRVLAIEQGARIMRGTRAHTPTDALEADLYMLLEGAAIDAEIVARGPRLRDALTALRREELARRPGMQRLVPMQREVERSLRALLASEPGAALPALPRTATAEQSAATAHTLALRARRGIQTRVAYRSIASVDLWDDRVAMGRRGSLLFPALSDFELRKTAAVAADQRADAQTPSDDGTEEMDSPEDGTGEAAATGERQGSSAGGARDAAGEPEGGDASDDASTDAETRGRTGGVLYPEWIERYGRLEPRHTTVRPVVAAERDGRWAGDALAEHGPLVRQVRERFALLRARRMRLRAQRSGDELDLGACIDALIDAQLGRVPSDRLYQTTRPTRHTLAITILVDTSGSTNAALSDGRTVLDVERLSLLLASEALEALGDPYSILAFSGLGRHEVRVSTVKAFGEHDSAAVHRRISSLAPEDNTRLGAAVRHATALLASQPAGRRVLLVLSDGRPNDVDRYQGIDAIEDSRQALLAARASGVHTFCLTVDSEEADYLPRLFGDGGYRMLCDPAHLPAALIRLVDRLLRG